MKKYMIHTLWNMETGEKMDWTSENFDDDVFTQMISKYPELKYVGFNKVGPCDIAKKQSEN